MSTSLFQRKQAEPTGPATPHELISKEVAHLKKKKSSRYGEKPVRNASVWGLVGVICVIIWLYVMDPVMHAWYKGDAIRTYVYLHYFGTSEQAAELASTGILRPDEIVELDRNLQTYKEDFASLQDAQVLSKKIINYMNSVKKLHAGKYEKLDFIGTARYDLFIRNGIETPTMWTSLDPVVNDGK